MIGLITTWLELDCWCDHDSICWTLYCVDATCLVARATSTRWCWLKLRDNASHSFLC